MQGQAMVDVLVTGANGFVGSTLCRKLAGRGDAVRGLVRATSDLALLEGVPVERVVGNLDDPASLEAATRGIEIVYHAAAAVTDWGTLGYFRRVNVEGTRNLLEAAVANGVQRFVHVSTVAVHSFIDAQEMDEQSPQLPTPFPYCQTKREAEALALDYHRRGEIDVTVVRPGDVYGPGDRVALLNMAGLLKAGRLPYVGGGRKLGAFAYVENLADGLILAGTIERAVGEAYVITDGVKMTWREYFGKLTAALGMPHPRISVHPALAYAAATLLEAAYRLLRLPGRPPVTRYLVAHLRGDFHFSIAKARRELVYEPRVGVDEGVRRTAEWYNCLRHGCCEVS
jgi:nucleoside-diphosphate-sugar epimerase